MRQEEGLIRNRTPRSIQPSTVPICEKHLTPKAERLLGGCCYGYSGISHLEKATLPSSRIKH